MRRRDVLALLGGGAVSLPLGARSQQKATPVIGLFATVNLLGRPILTRPWWRGSAVA